MIFVEDSGQGIPRESRQNVFHPFFTTRGKEGGSGLGLYICSQIASEIGGAISLEDGVHGDGARFRLEFPGAPGEKT